MHPFAVRAFFEESLVLTYSVDPADVQHLVPAGMRLDQHDGCAFMAAAFVQTKSLRPACLPSWFGRNFLLAGYRLFVRCQVGNRELRGLLVLRSTTDRRSMVRLGNLFTRYRYEYADIRMKRDAGRLSVWQAGEPGDTLDLEADVASEDGTLPRGSVFQNERSARKFAGPLPFTFTPVRGHVLVIGSKRTDWTPKIVQVSVRNDEAIRRRLGHTIRLAAAFHVTGVPYRWDRGQFYEVAS